MAEWTPYFNLAAVSGGLMAAVLGFVVTVTAPYMEGWGRRYLRFMFFLLAVYMVSDLVEQVCQYFFWPEYEGLARAS